MWISVTGWQCIDIFEVTMDYPGIFFIIILTALQGPCEEVTISVGFDLFRLEKLNKQNFNDIALNVISKQ